MGRPRIFHSDLESLVKIGLSHFSHILIAATLLCKFQTDAAPFPRQDLYRKIKIETGVSLKEAWAGVQGLYPKAITLLNTYSERVGIQPIEKSLRDEIMNRQKKCQSSLDGFCFDSIQDLKDQLSKFLDIHAKRAQLQPMKRLHFSLLVYLYGIKSRVLLSDVSDWSQKCWRQDKINTPDCRQQIFETHILADLAEDMGRVVFLKSEKVAMDVRLVKSIEERLVRYEK